MSVYGNHSQLIFGITQMNWCWISLVFPLNWWERNFSPRPNLFKRQNSTRKRPTTEKNMCAAQFRQSFSSARERKLQWEKREAGKASPYSVKDFSNRAFGMVMPPFWGGPAPVCHCVSVLISETQRLIVTRAERRRNIIQTVEKSCCDLKKWHIISLLFTWWMI